MSLLHVKRKGPQTVFRRLGRDEHSVLFFTLVHSLSLPGSFKRTVRGRHCGAVNFFRTVTRQLEIGGGLHKTLLHFSYRHDMVVEKGRDVQTGTTVSFHQLTVGTTEFFFRRRFIVITEINPSDREQFITEKLYSITNGSVARE